MARTLPSLTALKAFEAAARHQSFKAAAEELHVTHAAISRQVKALEAQLGLSLFERLNRRVLLTAAGRELLPVLERAFDEISTVSRRLAAPPTRGRLVLSVDPGFATRWLLRRLSRFRDHHSNIEVEIIPSLELLRFPHASIDAAIYYGQGPWPGLRQELLFSLCVFPVCGPDLVTGPHPLRRPGDLRHHRLLHERSVDWWRVWLQEAGAPEVDWSAGPIFHDSNLPLDAAAAGEGVAVGDNLLAIDDLESGRLCKPFALTCPTGSYYLVSPQDQADHVKLAAFRGWLRQACDAEAELRARWA